MFSSDGAHARLEMQTEGVGMEQLNRLLCWTRRSVLLQAFEAGCAEGSECEVVVLRGLLAGMCSFRTGIVRFVRRMRMRRGLR